MVKVISTNPFSQPILDPRGDSWQRAYLTKPARRALEDMWTKLGGDGEVTAVWGSIVGTLSNQTDLQSALDAKVDDSGDTMTGDLTFSGAGIQTADYIKFNTSYTVTGSEAIGTSFWDADNRTFSDVLEDGVVGQRYKEAFIDGQNDTGVQIDNGKPVAYAGSIGSSGNFRIKLSKASASESAFYNVGITTHDIANGAIGKITVRGKVRGIQTDGDNYGEVWSNGDIIYISGATAGYLTKTPPNAPIPAIPVALVIAAHPTNGTLEVRPTYPTTLAMLSDVDGTVPTITGQMLLWDNANAYWDVFTKAYFTANGATDAELTSTGDLILTCATDKTLKLTETAWFDLQWAISSGRVGVANFPDWDTAFTTNTGEYKFTVNDYIDLASNEVPHSWKEGTDGSVHMHLTLDGGNASGSDQFVQFTVYLAYADVNEVWTETSLTAEYTIPTGTADRTHLLLSVGTLTLTNQIIGNQIKPRIKRIAATGGTEYPNHIFVSQLGMHIEQDTIGSRQIASK